MTEPTRLSSLDPRPSAAATGGRARRTLRSVGLTVGAAALATTAAVGLGAGPQLAQADPGDTFVPIGTAQLVQSDDLASIQVPLDTLTVRLNRDDDFSSCLGEGNAWTSVLKGSPKPIEAAWTRTGHRSQALSETIAQAKDATQAKAFEKTLVRATIKDCQQDSPYDFHYGPITAFNVGAGHASYALSYRGSSTKPDGGVVVIRKGTGVGYLQVSGTFGDADQTMESVAKVATSRLLG